MRRVTLVVNGEKVTAEIEQRMQLVDFLRDVCLLTGTHVGCEHGVCGACTLLLDGAPARSCIAYAAACEGADVRSIEGLQDDPIMQRLRAAFTEEHALQCGYCTPGMLVTARDIVLRVPEADAARIRLELAGNLCRCTGYAGIVRAISRVLREDVARPDDMQKPLPQLSALVLPDAASASAAPLVTSTAPAMMPAAPVRQAGPSLQFEVSLNRPIDEVWAALRDPALLAACVPGARLTQMADGHLEGEIQVTFGPIAALFTGAGSLSLDPAARRATLSGEGRDRRSGTRLSATATFILDAATSTTTRIVLEVNYALRGPLAHLARGPVVSALTASIAETVARNLERRLAGETQAAVPAKFLVGDLLLRVVWQRLRRWLRLK